MIMILSDTIDPPADFWTYGWGHPFHAGDKSPDPNKYSLR